MYVTYVKFPRKMVFPSKEATPDEEDAEDEGAEAFDDIDWRGVDIRKESNGIYVLVCCVAIQKEPRFSLGVGNLACNPNRVG